MANSLVKTNFSSHYQNQFKEFIELKLASGTKSVRIDFLKKLDSYLSEKEISSKKITKTDLQLFLEKGINETPCTLYFRTVQTRVFLNYLLSIGYEVYIPRLPRYPKSNFQSYIFTYKEMDLIFAAADNLRFKRLYYNSNLFSIPILLRTLYSTGMRISEAIRLKSNDVDITHGRFTLKNTKNEVDRYVFISDSLKKELIEYNKYKEKCPTKMKGSEYLFTRYDGEKLCKETVRTHFKECLESLEKSDALYKARVHDLRHTFAVHSFLQMIDSGIRPEASLPILATYLGHSNYASTLHYIRLTEEQFPDLISKSDLYFLENIITVQIENEKKE